jgi:hypothetical protein
MEQLKEWSRCTTSTPPVQGGIASRLSNSDQLKVQFGTRSGAIHTTFIDLEPGNGGRGRGKKVVPKKKKKP